jgi:excinuclease ABC subunit C
MARLNTMNISAELQATLTNLPLEPGVYRMRDGDHKVIYVGKATCLKKRVQSYFNPSGQGSKTRALVRQIVSIDVSVTRSETEALLLESQLIKNLRPKYNVLMRDDKSYPYLYVSLKHDYPSLSMIRTKKNPQEKGYFGPYPGVNAVRETLNLIQKVFKLRNCRDGDFATRSRPCLQYQIGRCRAPCVGLISQLDYEQAVHDTTQFLRGKSQQLLNELGQRMNEAVEQMAFEEAAELRDQMKHLRLIQEQQGMTLREGDADVLVSYVRPGFACLQWVGVRGGQVLDSQVFFPTLPKAGLEQEDLEQAVFEAFIAHYYFDTPERIPALILTNHPVQEQTVWEEALRARREKACKIQINPRGAKARWIDFANDNLERAVAARRASKLLIEQRYEALQQALGLTSISRMVCFDISHTQGQDTVASCVVFDKQGPCKSAYRRLNIQGITPGDDYAAMEQAVTRYFRRLLHEDKPLPELAVIDGGQGQVSMAKLALDALGIQHVKILGVAKGPARKAGLERLILADDFQEMSWAPESPALHLLQHIRDESHRFAITAHRKKRQKTTLGSTLRDIPGVGEKRHQALLHRFGGLRELAKASREEIIKVEGINDALATRIYEHFHS